ncbi:MAG: response regulator transcription factor [Sulfurimonas sp.]|nr:response regulator transcription factor [Sulfurimonas sp.]MDQ7059899.1 response regulator transcription factor [Sulfurimonas sp.]
MEEKLKYSILFIEDEKDIRDNYTRYLKRHFSRVYEAEDGEDGYKIYKEKKPEIIILDINLPKLNGLELLKKIRLTDQTTKVIMLTAYSDTKYLLDAAELKLVKYLVKPITRNDLKSALEMAVQEFSNFDIVSKKVINLKDGLRWDSEESRLYRDGLEILFTKKEILIIALLFSSPNKIFTYEDIIMEVWGDYEIDNLSPLKTIIKNIRKKLPKDTVINVFGVGYKF